MLHVAKWETPPVRSKLDVTGGCLQSLPGKCLHAPISIAELQLDSSIQEPPSPSLKHSSGHHQVGGKILKFLKLRKKSTISQEAFQPSLTTFRFQDQSPSSVSVEDVDLERYHYDADEHSENVNNNCDRHHYRSASSATSTSSRSSASTQSFSSMTSRSSAVTPRASFMLGQNGHQSGAQLMANILISISNLDEDDEIGYEYDHRLDGPHESAWHQPRDEMFAAAGRHSSANKQSNSGRNTPRLGRCSIDSHLTSPGPSRRFGKLDLSRIDKLR